MKILNKKEKKKREKRVRKKVEIIMHQYNIVLRLSGSFSDFQSFYMETRLCGGICL